MREVPSSLTDGERLWLMEEIPGFGGASTNLHQGVDSPINLQQSFPSSWRNSSAWSGGGFVPQASRKLKRAELHYHGSHYSLWMGFRYTGFGRL